MSHITVDRQDWEIKSQIIAELRRLSEVDGIKTGDERVVSWISGMMSERNELRRQLAAAGSVAIARDTYEELQSSDRILCEIRNYARFFGWEATQESLATWLIRMGRANAEFEVKQIPSEEETNECTAAIEYRVFSRPNMGDITDVLNTHGKDGWMLVGTVGHDNMIFSRAKPAKLK